MSSKQVASVMIAVLTVGVLFTLPCLSAEVKYPTKPVHMWVGFPAGGSTDLCARSVSNIAEKMLGQPIVVENKPGGGGVLALELLVSAPADGYTLATTTDTPFTRAPHLVNVKYNSMEDFTPIVRLSLQRQGMMVKEDGPFKKWQDVVDFARKNPGQLTYGTPGIGTTSHLAMEKIAVQEKLKLQHVPFQGDPLTIAALLEGRVMAVSGSLGSSMKQVKAGAVRLLLIVESEGMEGMADVPTFKKMGYNFETPTAQMISAPKGVPKPIFDKLATVFSEAMMTPQFQKVARDLNLLAVKPLVGADFQKWLRAQYHMYGKFIKEVGLQKK